MTNAVKLFEAGGRRFLFAVDRSQIFAVGRGTFEVLSQALERNDGASIDALCASAGIDARANAIAPEEAATEPRSLSLSVAQNCNLACGYCYASGGNFGGTAKLMSKPVALAALQRLIEGCPPGERVQVVFLGGEPLINRPLVYAATEYAQLMSTRRGVRVGFSITTNGTLLTPDDLDFFERHGFSVTISVDGVRETHDRLRPLRSGRGSFDRLMERVTPFLREQRAMQVSARVTVTPMNLALRETLDDLLDRCFHSVGFSPLLNAPNGANQMSADALSILLAQMTACGEQFLEQVAAGHRYPFSNLTTALEQLHKGSQRRHPCGAGLGYFGVSADGGMYPCHRYVEDPHRRLGSVTTGVDSDVAENWRVERDVINQSPCTSCWARHLCGGGCHHEVEGRGRVACDYIRGWLAYCLQAYVRLSSANPTWFDRPAHHASQ